MRSTAKELVKQGEFQVFGIQVLNKVCNALPLTTLGLLNPELSLIWVILSAACTLTLCALCQFSRVTPDKSSGWAVPSLPFVILEILT